MSIFRNIKIILIVEYKIMVSPLLTHWTYHSLALNYIMWWISSMSSPDCILMYRKVSNIGHTLTGNKIVDHSDVVGAAPVNYIFILNLTPDFNGLDKDNCKMRWETFIVLGLGVSYIRELMVWYYPAELGSYICFSCDCIFVCVLAGTEIENHENIP